MPEIVISEHAPEIGQTTIGFTLRQGKFSDADLAAVKAAHAECGFSGRYKSSIFVFMKSRNFYPQIAEQAMLVLRQRMPDATFVREYGPLPGWAQRALLVACGSLMQYDPGSKEDQG